jgi:hypothetical protein
MGYYMYQLDTDFFSDKKYWPEMLKAIQKLHSAETIKDSSGKHFAWVNQLFYEIGSLEKILEEWRWTPEFDNIGNIIGLEFNGEKLGDEIILFKAIAPYVKSGSYITMRGEDEEYWRWEFVDGELIEKAGHITYE